VNHVTFFNNFVVHEGIQALNIVVWKCFLFKPISRLT
jgi:hypothetical protein